MYEVIGKKVPEYLLADPKGAEAFAIACEPGNGVVPRGTVMVRKAAGMWAPAESADVAETNMLCVLDETVDTEKDAKIAQDGKAWRAARLIYGKVTLKDGGALTAAHLVVLRKQGFVFDRMVGTEEVFDNEKKE